MLWDSLSNVEASGKAVEGNVTVECCRRFGEWKLRKKRSENVAIIFFPLFLLGLPKHKFHLFKLKLDSAVAEAASSLMPFWCVRQSMRAIYFLRYPFAESRYKLFMKIKEKKQNRAAKFSCFQFWLPHRPPERASVNLRTRRARQAERWLIDGGPWWSRMRTCESICADVHTSSSVPSFGGY